MVVGTFQYIAPEVLQGQEADARSDIFSFGCVLYEMITRRRAFEGKSQLSVMTAILEKDSEPLATLQPTAPPAPPILGCSSVLGHSTRFVPSCCPANMWGARFFISSNDL
jgi:serine/threonine protein kinase